MVADCLVSGLCTVERFVSNLAINLIATFHGGAETLAGLAYFFSNHLGGRLHYGLGIFGNHRL